MPSKHYNKSLIQLLRNFLLLDNVWSLNFIKDLKEGKWFWRNLKLTKKKIKFTSSKWASIIKKTKSLSFFFAFSVFLSVFFLSKDELLFTLYHKIFSFLNKKKKRQLLIFYDFSFGVEVFSYYIDVSRFFCLLHHKKKRLEFSFFFSIILTRYKKEKKNIIKYNWYGWKTRISLI